MKQINFSDIGVVVNSMEELDELVTLYNALDIEFDEEFIHDIEDAKRTNLVKWYVQTTRGGIKTKLDDDRYVSISLINYPIEYAMESLDFAVAYHLITSNQTDELTAHLNKYCKECK